MPCSKSWQIRRGRPEISFNSEAEYLYYEIMKLNSRKYLDKLYFKHWKIGVCRGDIKEVIRTKQLPLQIKWLRINSTDHHNADPFIIRTNEGSHAIFYEDLKLDDQYGKIYLIKIDGDNNISERKLLLDTGSHLSYPFIYKENGKMYVFPEASKSGRLSCYEFDQVNETMRLIKEILPFPMLDSTIVKFGGRYWLFATINGKDSHNKLFIYYSEELLGPYISHPQNPVKDSLSSSRPAGNFIEVDGTLFRPSQNCVAAYGESITINRINRLDINGFSEEPYFTISAKDLNLSEKNIHTIHTINFVDDIIVIDGQKWTFSPINQWKFHQINRKAIKASRTNQSSK